MITLFTNVLVRSNRVWKGVAAVCAAGGMLGLHAQEAVPAGATTVAAVQPAPSAVELAANDAAAATALPDAPGYGSSSLSEDSLPATGSASASTALAFGQNITRPAGRYDKVVQPGQTPPRMSVHDKVILGVRENIGFVPLAGWVISAGYAQATNGSPNYGQTGKGFAQRLGAAAARGSSENIFQDSVLASVLHEDPRYYRMGSGHNFFSRLVYAGTRPLIGRTDGGRRTINFSDLGGDLAGAALTQAYYPPLNRGTTEVLRTFGGSVGGDALGYVVSEFLPSVLHSLHHSGQ